MIWFPILMYHRIVERPRPRNLDPYQNCVTVTSFENHLRWLRSRNYVSVPLGGIADALDRNVSVARAAPRQRPVAITFDDGYTDNFELARPLLKRYGFSATFFVVVDAIGKDNSFDAAYSAERITMLSANQLRELRDQGFSIGSHTLSHPGSLMRLNNEQLATELVGSRATLEALLDAQVHDFSYPHSKVDDRVESAVVRAGYRTACAGRGTRSSRYRLFRVEARDRGGLDLWMRMAAHHGRAGLKSAYLDRQVSAQSSQCES